MLRESGVRADKRLEQRAVGARPSSFAVTVARPDEPRALRILAERGLPRTMSTAVASGSKLLGLPGDGRSEALAQLQQSLGETLESLPAVQEARVHLALPEPDPLHPLGQLRPTAAVLLRLRAPLPLAAADVALLIARAVPGLDAADVAVLSAPTEAPAQTAASPGEPAGTPAWLLPLLLGLCAVLLAACAGLLAALRARRLVAPSPAAPPAKDGENDSAKDQEPAGRRAFP